MKVKAVRTYDGKLEKGAARDLAVLEVQEVNTIFILVALSSRKPSSSPTSLDRSAWQARSTRRLRTRSLAYTSDRKSGRKTKS